MRAYTYSQARQQLSRLLDEAKEGDVVIKRKNGDTFVIRCKIETGSLFDIPSVVTARRITTGAIVSAARVSRERSAAAEVIPSNRSEVGGRGPVRRHSRKSSRR
jgi:hypothetical protein